MQKRKKSDAVKEVVKPQGSVALPEIKHWER